MGIQAAGADELESMPPTFIDGTEDEDREDVIHGACCVRGPAGGSEHRVLGAEGRDVSHMRAA